MPDFRTLRHFCLVAAMIPLSSLAATTGTLPVGDFGVGASVADWTIDAADKGYVATSHAQGDVQPVFVLTNAGRLALWKRLNWPEETAQDAECLGNMLDVFCHVTEQIAARIDPLKHGGSNYFHYDRVRGAQVIHRLFR